MTHKKYYYNNAMSKRHYLDCTKYAREWINQDLPDIYRLGDHTRAIEVTFPEYKVLIYAEDKPEADLLELFVRRTTGKEPEVYI